ncbi:GNAT family N-acetyltransferase [Tenacibaculum xiamenense]|uniref:GNAT family N-acetyltransferase n=1 Tax=Tenacibaculum xiamenense TaxID=1261553 RepID=UPI0038941EB1
MKVEKANENDSELLTQLTIRSKDHWNYGAKQISEWKEDLKVSSEYIRNNHVYKLVETNKILGFYAFEIINKEKIKLNFLFIEPEFIGKGYGKKLLTHFLLRIKQDGFKKAYLDADPNAEVFYKRNGFKSVGKIESSIKNRFLPIMEIEL